MSKYQTRTYDYSYPGLATMEHREPVNYFGDYLMEANRETAYVNKELMKTQ